MKYLLPALLLALVACNKSSETIPGLKEFKYEGGDHQDGRIDYKEALPVGGPHNPRWQNCGIYDKEIYDVYAVHSLEHGAVWATYRPNINTSEVMALKDALGGRTHTLLTPRADQPSPIVLTAWNTQLELDSASDPRLKQFIQKFEQGGSAPEIGAACSGSHSNTQ